MSLNERNMGTLLMAIPRPLSSFLLLLSNFFLPFSYDFTCSSSFSSPSSMPLSLWHPKFCFAPVQEFIFTSPWQFNFIWLWFFFLRRISCVILFHGIQSYAKIDSWINGTNCCPWNRVTCDKCDHHVIALQKKKK